MNEDNLPRPQRTEDRLMRAPGVGDAPGAPPASPGATPPPRGSGHAWYPTPTPAPLGRAFAQEMVAQATAMAVADATSYLRGVGTLTAASMAACTQLMIQNKDPQYAGLMQQMNQTLEAASQTFQNIGTRAADVLSRFSVEERSAQDE